MGRHSDCSQYITFFLVVFPPSQLSLATPPFPKGKVIASPTFCLSALFLRGTDDYDREHILSELQSLLDALARASTGALTVFAASTFMQTFKTQPDKTTEAAHHGVQPGGSRRDQELGTWHTQWTSCGLQQHHKTAALASLPCSQNAPLVCNLGQHKPQLTELRLAHLCSRTDKHNLGCWGNSEFSGGYRAAYASRCGIRSYC